MICFILYVKSDYLFLLCYLEHYDHAFLCYISIYIAGIKI